MLHNVLQVGIARKFHDSCQYVISTYSQRVEVNDLVKHSIMDTKRTLTSCHSADLLTRLKKK